MKHTSASSPPRTASTSDSTVASPQSTRCCPQIHRSPGRETGSAGGSGASSASSPSSASPSSNRSSSPSSKPSSPRSTSSSRSAASSAASISSFQPACVCDLVVRNHQCAALRGREVREHDHRCFRQAKLACREDTTVSRDDHPVIADQHRVHEAELCDRARDLRDLGVGMRPGVARVRDQAVERPTLDLGRLNCDVMSDVRGGNREVVTVRGYQWAIQALRGLKEPRPTGASAPKGRSFGRWVVTQILRLTVAKSRANAPRVPVTAREDPRTASRANSCDHIQKSSRNGSGCLGEKCLHGILARCSKGLRWCRLLRHALGNSFSS